MVDTVQAQQQAAWRVARPLSSYALLPAGILAGGIIGLVILAGSALTWQGSSMKVLWVMFGITLAWLAVRKLSGSDVQIRRPTLADHSLTVGRGGSIVQRDKRRHPRFVPVLRGTTLHLMDGRAFDVRVIDLSVAGVAIETRISERDLNAVTRVGTRSAALIRQTPTGAVFGFDTLLDAGTFDAAFTL